MNHFSSVSRISRRQFIATTAAALAAPIFIPASALGKGGRPAPSERIVMGIIGWGMMGPPNTNSFMNEKDCQVVAACDLDKRPLKLAVDAINKHYGNNDCKAYHDYREMMARNDIDAVMIAVPDHWHALAAIEACKQNKDIYGEKPLARTIAEQQAIVKAVQKHKRIWQTGSWQRSEENFHKAAEIVRNGLIGKVTHVEIGLPGGHVDFNKTGNLTQPTEPPPELDYDMWVGPSKMMPYIEARLHMNWRWNYNFGGGQLLDWYGHHGDIAHWGLGFDNTGPVEIEGVGEFPPKDAMWNTATKYRINLKYPNGVTMTTAGDYPDIMGGTKWIGTDGWVWVNRGSFDASNAAWKEWKEVPDDLRKIKLTKSRNHYRNFLDSVKSRRPTITPVETAHHSLIPGHLGLISMLIGRKIKWDPIREHIIDDSEASKLLTNRRNYKIDTAIIDDREASKLLTRDYRPPWKFA